MIITEMSTRECGDLLARLGFGRLACARENQPYIVPTYFTYKSGCLYGFATMGRKIEWMRLNPLVCIEADEVRSRAEWESVVARGRYEEVSDAAQHANIRKKAEALLEKHESWWQMGFAAAQTRAQHERDVPIFYCVHIDEITGHRACPDPAPVSIG